SGIWEQSKPGGDAYRLGMRVELARGLQEHCRVPGVGVASELVRQCQERPQLISMPLQAVGKCSPQLRERFLHVLRGSVGGKLLGLAEEVTQVHDATSVIDRPRRLPATSRDCASSGNVLPVMITVSSRRALVAAT